MYIPCLDKSFNFTDVVQAIPLKLCILITFVKLYTFVPALLYINI